MPSHDPCTAVFLEPLGAILELVLRGKRTIREAHPDAVYLSHPPHSTLMLARTDNRDEFLSRCTRTAARLAPVRIAAEGIGVFRHDPLAEGAHSVHVRIRPTDELQHLQSAFAAALDGLTDAARLPRPPGHWPEPMQASARRFGWPFAGPHWLPHFTLAAIPPDDPAGLVSQFLTWPGHGEFEASTVSVWAIDGERHRRLLTLELRGSPQA